MLQTFNYSGCFSLNGAYNLHSAGGALLQVMYVRRALYTQVTTEPNETRNHS